MLGFYDCIAYTFLYLLLVYKCISLGYFVKSSCLCSLQYLSRVAWCLIIIIGMISESIGRSCSDLLLLKKLDD